MSHDLGTTPIIADLKGRRVLVTGECVVAFFFIAMSLAWAIKPICWPKAIQLHSHAEGLRHATIHPMASQPRCTLKIS